MCSLSVLGDRSPRSRYQHGWFSAGWRALLVCALASCGFQQSLVFLGLERHFSNLYLHFFMTFSFLRAFPSGENKGHWIEDSPHALWPWLNSPNHTCKHLFPNKTIFWGSKWSSPLYVAAIEYLRFACLLVLVTEKSKQQGVVCGEGPLAAAEGGS